MRRHDERPLTYLILGGGLLSLLALAVPGWGQVAPQAKAILVGFAVDQAYTPVSILSTKSTREFLYEEVEVQNTSPQAVVAVTFGVVLYPRADERSKPVIIRCPSVPTNIKPGDKRRLEAFALPVGSALAHTATFQPPQAVADLGIVSVEFLGATPWTYDPAEHGGFRPTGM